MNDTVKVGVIGVGSRGAFLTEQLCALDNVDVVAVCDEYTDRLDAAVALTAEKQGFGAKAYTDHRSLLEAEPDCVVIATSWDSHARIAIDAMEAGIVPGIECGGASSLDEVWRMVRTSERTGIPMMFLENCCFGHDEMTILRMIKQGMFGEVVHCEGGYQHHLCGLVAGRDTNRQARFETYMHKNAEIYPSHELGPIMKYLDINHGNRIISLCTMTSKAVGMKAYNGEVTMQGDVCTTLLKCAHGESIVLTYDTTLPRPYSRAGRVDGTEGCYLADKNAVYIESVSPGEAWEDFGSYLEDERYEHPMWQEYRRSGTETGGHGGMDMMVVREFTDSVREHRQPYLDVYDAALLMAITPLSEQSVLRGGRPVAVPDFTDGKWIKR